jgi:hypothetical protein
VSAEYVARRVDSGAPTEVVAALAFACGLTAGLLLPRLFRRFRPGERLHSRRHTTRETVVYDENLPASLSRREPAPEPQQPRYGGTGSLGVSPRAVNRALGREESTDPSAH